MNNISNIIYTYYIEHFEELPLDKQLHFALRLYSWDKDSWARQTLDDLRSKIMPEDDASQTLRDILAGRFFELRAGSERLRAIRQPYFDRYPSLRQNAALLYWALMLENGYGVDGRKAISDVVPEQELQELYEKLLTDTTAITTLSTYAINFLFLYKRYLVGDETGLEPSWLLDAANAGIKPISSAEQMQTINYFLSHSMIAESLFYNRRITPGKLNGYQQLVQQLETYVAENYARLGLDNKLEFLVCCKLTDYSSLLAEQILEEASRSVSETGSYLIDRHNEHVITTYTTLDKSEHRNLLYLLATRQQRY